MLDVQGTYIFVLLSQGHLCCHFIYLITHVIIYDIELHRRVLKTLTDPVKLRRNIKLETVC